MRNWYQGNARPFLLEEEAGRVQELDHDLERLLEREKQAAKPLSACFVGGAGIGKSTLINALVAGAEVVVPSGGVGPLTAQALEITYGDTPSFSAIYHPPARVWKLAFALESELRRQEAGKAVGSDTDLARELEAEDLAEAQIVEVEPTKKIEQLRKQAQLIITGKQDSEYDLAYLVDCLRESIGQERVWGTTPKPEDMGRLERLKEILVTEHRKAESVYELDATSPTFRQELNDHAAGFLAPLIAHLEVVWNSPLLQQGLRLTDLPGLGIAGDVYRKVTEKWVRSEAQAVVLVVTHRGVTESDANLLRESGFLSRLLHSIDDPASDPVRLLIAVVKTDEIAEDRRSQDKSKKKREHLADVMAECDQLVRSQLRDRLLEAWSMGGEDVGEGKQATVQRILDGLQVYPVSAREYRRWMADDEDDPSFLSDPQESGVPAMAEGLMHMSDRFALERGERHAEALASFHTRVSRLLEVIRARWEERTRAKEEADALRAELDSFLKPLREEFRARQGGYRTFLKESLPQNIEKVVLEASLTANKAVRAYLRKLRDAHWKTLQAAVKREGTYYGARHIDLPADFSQAFEDPVAEAWSKTILTELRKRTNEFSKDCLTFVDQVVEWARSKGGRVQPRLIEAQRDAIAADTKHLATVGKTAVNDLRDRVKSELFNAIEGPIRKRCRKFVDDNSHVGTGVRNRILDLFDQLADTAIEAARAPAVKVLLENYQVVEQEILDAWKNHNDPLKAAADAIAASHEDSVKRSDAQKRRVILERVQQILDVQPSIDETELVAS